MSFYNDHILPHLINLAMRNRELRPYRERVVSGAKGRVLEIGIGSGLNLPLYGTRVEEILGLEPAAPLLAMARDMAGRSEQPVTFIAGSAEAIPIEDHSIDTVVTTWTLCSIPDAVGALKEIGHPIDDPEIFDVKVRPIEGPLTAPLARRIDEVARAELEMLGSIWREAVDGALVLW